MTTRTTFKLHTGGATHRRGRADWVTDHRSVRWVRDPHEMRLSGKDVRRMSSSKQLSPYCHGPAQRSVALIPKCGRVCKLPATATKVIDNGVLGFVERVRAHLIKRRPQRLRFSA